MPGNVWVGKCRKAAHTWHEEEELTPDPRQEQKVRRQSKTNHTNRKTQRRKRIGVTIDDKETLFESWGHEPGKIGIIVDNDTLAETINGRSTFKDKRLTIICKEFSTNLEQTDEQGWRPAGADNAWIKWRSREPNTISDR